MILLRVLKAIKKQINKPFFIQNRQKCDHDTGILYILFKKNLLLTNSLSSGVFMAIGDLVQQEYEYQKKIIPKRYDWARSLRMFVVGNALGPLHHYWYIYLDKMLPHVTIKTVVQKILYDQFLISPITLVCFFYGMGILEQKSLGQSTDEIKTKFSFVYMVNITILLLHFKLTSYTLICLKINNYFSG